MAGQVIANPSNAQMRAGFEDTGCGLGDVSTFQDLRFRSETLGAELPVIPDDSIGPFGEEEEGSPSKIDPGGVVNVNWAAEDHAKFIASFFGKGDAAVDLGGALAFRHRFQITATVQTFKSLGIEVFRDRGRPDFYVGVTPSQMTFGVAPRGFVNGAVTFAIPRFAHHDDPTVEAGVGPIPLIRGLYGFTNLQLATADLGDFLVEITALPGTGGADFDVAAKIGIAGVLGTAIPIFVGNDSDGNPIFTPMLVTAADVHAGQDDELPIEVHYKDATAAAVLDQHRFPRRRDTWSQTLPVKALFNETATTIKLGGTKKRMRQAGVTLTRPVTPDDVIGGRFVDFNAEQGDRTAVWTLSRRALGNEFADRLLSGEPADLEMDMASTLIATTAIRRRLQLISRRCIIEGRTASVAGRAQFDEAITLRAHPNADATYPSAIAAELTNTQSDIDP